MDDLKNWTPRPAPDLRSAQGRHARLDAAQWPDDAAALFDAVGGPGDGDLWRYIPFGPPESAEALGAMMASMGEQQDWRTQIIRCADAGGVLGMASYMRNRPEHGSTEVGCIVFSRRLQRTPAATEAMYLMARHVFDDLGYRRYEWKCHDANEASKRAALRLGFVPEGVFRQDMVMKGENRDTAWFSMLDTEWPKVKAAFEAWLAPENFGPDGAQRRSLAEIRRDL